MNPTRRVANPRLVLGFVLACLLVAVTSFIIATPGCSTLSALK
ncbi:hypothetical protein [Rothia nasimurium]|nr:hypothetical protein [Rothia nasimurium]